MQEKTERNEAIVDLRKYDKKKWSIGRLGKAFDINKEAVYRILRRKGVIRKKRIG